MPDDAADEERAEPVEVERGLLRLAHRLDDGGEREQLLADQPDDEVVVVAVEPVAGEPDVVRVIGGAERHADRAVLGENRALLFRSAAVRTRRCAGADTRSPRAKPDSGTVRRGRSSRTSRRSGS